VSKSNQAIAAMLIASGASSTERHRNRFDGGSENRTYNYGNEKENEVV
jgi:hypothetical protein